MIHASDANAPAATSIGFSNVDQAGSGTLFVDYLDRVRTVPTIAKVDHALIQAILSRRPDTILEIGCGTGDVLAALVAEAAAPVRGVGVEKSAALAEEARARHRGSDGLDFVVHDFMEAGPGTELERLGYGPGSVDAILLNRVVQHLDTPARLLANALHTLRAGGVVVISDIDWTSLKLDHPDAATSRQVVAAHVASVINPSAGAMSSTLLAELGLRHPTVALDIRHKLHDFALANQLFNLSGALDNCLAATRDADTARRQWLGAAQRHCAAGQFRAEVRQTVVVAEFEGH